MTTITLHAEGREWCVRENRWHRALIPYWAFGTAINLYDAVAGNVPLLSILAAVAAAYALHRDVRYAIAADWILNRWPEGCDLIWERCE